MQMHLCLKHNQLPEIHQVEFPFVKEWCHNRGFDHAVTLDYHSLLCIPVYKKVS